MSILHCGNTTATLPTPREVTPQRVVKALPAGDAIERLIRLYQIPQPVVLMGYTIGVSEMED